MWRMHHSFKRIFHSFKFRFTIFKSSSPFLFKTHACRTCVGICRRNSPNGSASFLPTFSVTCLADISCDLYPKRPLIQLHLWRLLFSVHIFDYQHVYWKTMALLSKLFGHQDGEKIGIGTSEICFLNWHKLENLRLPCFPSTYALSRVCLWGNAQSNYIAASTQFVTNIFRAFLLFYRNHNSREPVSQACRDK